MNGPMSLPTTETNPGMTERLFLAGMIAQELCSAVKYLTSINYVSLSKVSLNIADELIKQNEEDLKSV